MNPRDDRRESLTKEIDALRAELGEREKALPAHSIRPHQLLAIEELEQKIRLLEKKWPACLLKPGENP
jgi:hypothetical protein